MEKTKENKRWNKGEKLYDSFIRKLFGRNRMNIAVPNPRTNTLELFAVLDERGEKDLLIGAMCFEIAESIVPESLFAEKGELFKYEKTKKLF